MVLAIEIWGSLMRGKCIVFFSDYQAVVEIINKQTSKDRFSYGPAQALCSLHSQIQYLVSC